MRIVRDIRSDRVVVAESARSSAAALSALPFSVMLLLCWVGSPSWGGGRLIVTLVLGGIVSFLLSLAFFRQRTILVPANAELRWADGLETDDPFRLVLVQGGNERHLFCDRDPAALLTQARKLAQATGAQLVLPPDLADLARPATAPRPLALSGTATFVGTAWNAQLRAAQAALGAGAFVFIVFVVSARAESGLSTLSVGLPLASVVVAIVIGAALLAYRLQVTLGPSGLKAERTLWGFRSLALELPSARILGVRKVGHPRFLSTHLLIETADELFALSLAQEAALRAVAHCHAAGEARDRPIARAERLETSGAIP